MTMSKGAAAAVTALLLAVSSVDAANVWTWDNGGGLSASAQVSLINSTTIQMILENTSTALPENLDNRRRAKNQLLTAFSLALPRRVDILGGSAVLGTDAETLGFDRVASQLTDGGDVSVEWGYGNHGRGRRLEKHFITTLRGGSHRFARTANLDGRRRLGGPQAGLTPETLLAPLGRVGAISGPVVFTIRLDRAITEDDLNAARTIVAFGRKAHLISGATVSQTADPPSEPQQEPAVVALGSPVNGLAIVGGTVTVGVTVGNVAPVGSADLNYAMAANVTSGSANLGPLSTQTGTLAPGGSQIVTVNATSSNVGVNTIQVSASDPASANGSADQDVTLTVLDHSNASFEPGADTDELEIDMGTWFQGSGTQVQQFTIFNRVGTPGYTAALDLDSISPSGDTDKLFASLVAFANLSAGSGQAFYAYFDTAEIGTFSSTFVLSLSDEDLPGAADQTLALTLFGTVMAPEEWFMTVAPEQWSMTANPEPHTLALLAIGGLGAFGWSLRRRRAC